jgi:hypothetical protein
MDIEVIKALGGGGIAAALLTLIYLVGMKLVEAIDRIGMKVDEHTKTDVEHHAEVRAEVASLGGKIDGILDAHERADRRLTPGSGIRRIPTAGGR